MQAFQATTCGDLFERAIRRHGSLVAVSDGGEVLDYTALGDRVCRFMAVFADLGLQRGDAIAQLSHNRVDGVALIAAAAMFGLCYVPMHPMGSLDLHRYVLRDADVRALVFDERGFADRVAELQATGSDVELVLSFGASAGRRSLLDLAAAAQPLECCSLARGEDRAVIVYTGGTTGEPKGVVLSHDNIVSNTLIAMAEWDWPTEIRFLATTPISHATFTFILPVLLKGGEFVLRSGFTVPGFCETVRSKAVTATFLVPTMLYVLLDAWDDLDPADLSTLQTVIYGASPVSPIRLQEALAKLGPIFMQLYGQAEALTTISALFKRHHDPENIERLSSCGVPLAGMDVRLLDDQFREVPVGEVGEICVRGPVVMTGYWKRPEATAEALKQGWLRTGDLATRDEQGFLSIVDRMKDMVISGGFNLYPRQIEDILNAHPDVRASAVIGVPDEKWGEAVKAYVVPHAGRTAAAADIIAFVKQAGGSLIAPKTVELVEDLPLTPVGKVDKKALRSRDWSGRTRNVG